jgi:hypothetical protein
LIAKQVPINPSTPETKRLLRTSIQSYNGTAFADFEKYQANSKSHRKDYGISNTYPKYGIDANRDVGRWLPSTNRFIDFIEGLHKKTVPENIKVIMVHGYYPNGGVFGTYKVIPNGEPDKKAELADGAKKFAYAFWEYLFSKSTPTPFFGDTNKDPLGYAGEWNQILYKDFGILSVDIELPKKTYDEGRRGDEPKEDYNPESVRKAFESGVLVTGKGDFYTLLETYSDKIRGYNENQTGTANR